MIIGMHDRPAILRAILDGYALPASGEHGIAHWARVLEIGLKRALLEWAHERAVAWHQPTDVLAAWGWPPNAHPPPDA